MIVLGAGYAAFFLFLFCFVVNSRIVWWFTTRPRIAVYPLKTYPSINEATKTRNKIKHPTMQHIEWYLTKCTRCTLEIEWCAKLIWLICKHTIQYKQNNKYRQTKKKCENSGQKTRNCYYFIHLSFVWRFSIKCCSFFCSLVLLAANALFAVSYIKSVP